MVRTAVAAVPGLVGSVRTRGGVSVAGVVVGLPLHGPVFRRAAPLGVAVLGVAVVGIASLGIASLGIAVLGIAVLLATCGLAVLGFAVRGLALLRLVVLPGVTLLGAMSCGVTFFGVAVFRPARVPIRRVPIRRVPLRVPVRRPAIRRRTLRHIRARRLLFCRLARLGLTVVRRLLRRPNPSPAAGSVSGRPLRSRGFSDERSTGACLSAPAPCLSVGAFRTSRPSVPRRCSPTSRRWAAPSCFPRAGDVGSSVFRASPSVSFAARFSFAARRSSLSSRGPRGSGGPLVPTSWRGLPSSDSRPATTSGRRGLGSGRAGSVPPLWTISMTSSVIVAVAAPSSGSGVRVAVETPSCRLASSVRCTSRRRIRRSRCSSRAAIAASCSALRRRRGGASASAVSTARRCCSEFASSCWVRRSDR